MTPKISLLVPTVTQRVALLGPLIADIERQIAACQYHAEVIIQSDSGEMQIGDKRNKLLSMATGEYCAFIDDDDVISPTYLDTYASMIEDGSYDCASFVGAYYLAGKFQKLFLHSTEFTEWSETPQFYIRMPNHLNLIRTAMAQQIGFPGINHGEDHNFSQRLMQSGLVKKEYKVPHRALYHYLDGMKENRSEFTHEFVGDRVLLHKKKP